MRVAVLGTGYVGLVSGTCLAALGHDVVCMDIDTAKVARLQDGEVPIYEPGLADLLKEQTAHNRLHFTADLAVAVAKAEMIMLALPTPPNDDGSADVSYVLEAVRQAAPLLHGQVVLVTKSTVPVGTGRRIEAVLREAGAGHVAVASNPEFLREGLAIHDFMEPERIVVGTETSHVRHALDTLYEPLRARGALVLHMDRSSAELAKYAANSLLATKISFMNEVANLCEQVGADVDQIRQALGSDSRIGPKFLNPGMGYGGSCFPKDLLGLIHTGREHGVELRILQATVAANQAQMEVLAQKVRHHFGDDLTGRSFALWGLAFKPDTDDVREAPARALIDRLLAGGATVRAFDPVASDNMRKLYPQADRLILTTDMYDALEASDALLIATEWPVFSEADLGEVRRRLKQPLILDGRNLFDPRTLREQGIAYESIGRPIPR